MEKKTVHKRNKSQILFIPKHKVEEIFNDTQKKRVLGMLKILESGTKV
jgi:hypothetical protein